MGYDPIKRRRGSGDGQHGSTGGVSATSDEMTAALNSALEAGDLNSTMGRMDRAHRMKWLARETGLGEKSFEDPCGPGLAPSSIPTRR